MGEDKKEELLTELSAKLDKDGYEKSKAQEIWDGINEKLSEIDVDYPQESIKEIFESVLGGDHKYMSVTNQIYEYLNSDEKDDNKKEELLTELRDKLYKDDYDESKAQEIFDGINEKLSEIDAKNPQVSIKEIFESVLGGDHKYMSVTNQIYEYLNSADDDEDKKEELLTELSAKLYKDGYDESKAQEIWDGIDEKLSEIDVDYPQDSIKEIFESVLGGDHKYISVTNQIYEYLNSDEEDDNKKEELLTELTDKLYEDNYQTSESKAQEIFDGINDNLANIDAKKPTRLS